jgi:glycosyltransferase involved in cell wall biosynthesis
MEHTQPNQDPRNMATSRVARVAAVIPVYCATYLAEALASVFAQSRLPDEVIVVDDGSPEQAILADAVEPYRDRITLLRQRNQGWPAARNAATQATSADFIALLDADDWWLPEFLRAQLTVFDEHPDADLVYSNGTFIGRTPLAGRTYMDECPSEGPVTFESLIAQHCTVLLSSVVVRRRALLDAGGFDTTIKRGADFEMWLRMARRGARLTFQRTPLVLHRIHEANVSGTALNQVERPLRILERLVSTTGLSDHESQTAHDRIRHLRGELAREQGKESLRAGDFQAARREFIRARHEISSWKLRAALLGLRVAPQLVRTIYLRRIAAIAASVARRARMQRPSGVTAGATCGR